MLWRLLRDKKTYKVDFFIKNMKFNKKLVISLALLIGVLFVLFLVGNLGEGITGEDVLTEAICEDGDHDHFCTWTGEGTKPGQCPDSCVGYDSKDCDDGNATINPGVTEICDNIDNNCDETVDEGCDDDNDNYCDKTMSIVGTPPTCTKGGGDCNDTNNQIHPGTPEKCDGIDNDCDGVEDGANATKNSCSIGFQCISGNCTCLVSDYADIFIKGPGDICISQSKIKEFFCANADTGDYDITTCPSTPSSNYPICHDAECKSCVDYETANYTHDEDGNKTIKGTTLNGSLIVYDECNYSTDHHLIESYCVGSDIKSVNYDCLG